jgi:hypothetical protein
MEGFSVLERTDFTYLEKILLDEKGELKIVSYEELKNVPQSDISQFCVKYGVYNIPTLEMIDFLKEQIGDKEKTTIEIGAGNGVLAKTLGITATDSRQQDLPEVRTVYILSGQTPVKYGDNIHKCSAIESIKLYKPNIVLGAWVTHKYNAREHWRGGNRDGIDESIVIKKVKKYIFIGNENTHKNKPILNIPHQTIHADWLVSSSMNKDKNVIWIWEKL